MLGTLHVRKIAVIVEIVDRDIVNLAIGIDLADIDKGIALANPDTVLGLQDRLLMQQLRTQEFALLVEIGCHQLANQDADDGQDDTGLEQRPEQVHHGESGSTHGHELALLGKPAETEQSADQQGDREKLVEIAGRAHERDQQQLRHGVVALAHVADVVDEISDAAKRDQHHEHHDGPDSEEFQQVPVKLAHAASSPHA